MSDLPSAGSTATALIAALQAGRLSSRDLLEQYLQRIAESNDALNAVVTLDAEGARAQADAADLRLSRGEPSGPLDGLPMTIKDVFDTAGMRTTAGVCEFSERVPETDAAAVARLRRAGAIIFGKTNVPAWAGAWFTDNDVFGRTRNPWNLDRTPGGSSGGAAAALAAGMTPLELGSDIGGSIRVPAHFCGVFGHKPSYGLVPLAGHLPPAPGALAELDLNCVGPMGCCVDDLTLGLDLLAGPAQPQAVAWQLVLPPARKTRLSKLRIGAWLDGPVAEDQQPVFDRAVAQLEAAGARIDRAARPAIELEQMLQLYLTLLMPISGVKSEASFGRLLARLADTPDDAATGLADWARHRVAGRHRHWLAADEQREQLRRRWASFFETHDVLLAPVYQTVAGPHVEPPWDDAYTRLFTWPALATVAYLPATVVPVGLTAQGLPVGIQVIGPYLEDRTALAAARCISEVLPVPAAGQ